MRGSDIRGKTMVLAGLSLILACPRLAAAFDADLGTLVQSPRIVHGTTQLELQGDRTGFDESASSGTLYAIQGRLSHALLPRIQLRGGLGHASLDDDRATSGGLEVKIGLPASQREALALLLGVAHSELSHVSRTRIVYTTFDSTLERDTLWLVNIVREHEWTYQSALAWSTSLADSLTGFVTVLAQLNQTRGEHAYAGLNAAGMSWTHGPVTLLAEGALLSPHARRMLAGYAAYALNGWIQLSVNVGRDFDQRWTSAGLGMALRNARE